MTLSGASESVRVGRIGIHCCREPRTEVSLCQGPPSGQGRQWKRNFVTPVSELPAQTPVPTHRYEPREVRRQGKPRKSRSPSRRVVVKLGSRSACADGAPTRVGAPSFILVGRACVDTAHTPDGDREHQHRRPARGPVDGTPVMLDAVRACRAANVRRGSPEVPHGKDGLDLTNKLALVSTIRQEGFPSKSPDQPKA